MVKGERKALEPTARLPINVPADEPVETIETPAEPTDEAEVDPMADTSTGMAAVVDPALWDPVPVTLPTYVDKAEAARSVRTIDLDSTGVWSSGRSESDSALVREADEAARSAKAAEAEERRAAGS